MPSATAAVVPGQTCWLCPMLWPMRRRFVTKDGTRQSEAVRDRMSWTASLVRFVPVSVLLAFRPFRPQAGPCRPAQSLSRRHVVSSMNPVIAAARVELHLKKIEGRFRISVPQLPVLPFKLPQPGLLGPRGPGELVGVDLDRTGGKTSHLRRDDPGPSAPHADPGVSLGRNRCPSQERKRH
jgi:hypothetical protein